MASATPSAGEQRRTKMALFYSNLRSSFLSRLKQQLGVENTTNAVENGGTLEHEKEATSVWLLSTALFSANGSHVSINNLNDTDTPTYTNLRFRYLHVQAYANAMNLNQLNLNYSPSSENGCDDKSSTPPITNNTFKPLDLIPNLIDSNQSNLVCVSKQHIHSWVAFNMCYKLAAPLIVFPKSDDHIENNLENRAIKKTAIVGESANGDLTSLTLVLDWLKLFAHQISSTSKESNMGEGDEDVMAKKRQKKTIILANSYVYLKLCMLGQKEPELVDQINSFMSERRMCFLFYPTENASTAEIYQLPLLDNLFWRLVGEYSLRANPSSQLAVLRIFHQAMREIAAKRTVIRTWFLRFAQMAEIESYVSEHMPECCDLAPAESSREEARETTTTTTTTAMRREESKTNLITQDVASESSDPSTPAPASSSSSQPPVKLTEAEVLDYCEWVDDMSRIGSLCIKYTFLRDLYLKQTSKTATPSASTSSKDLIVSEKKWLDLIGPKNRAKFKYSGSMGLLSENDYLLKWLDTQSWRLNYHQFVRTGLVSRQPLSRADQLWTFDVITFPYSVPQTLLRQPERDFEQRPRNLRPRVSVLFAFSASGDYLQPYFVYPQTFVDNNEGGSTSGEGEGWSTPPTSGEWSCVAPNGYVTFRVFETWFFDKFLPYLNQQYKNDNDNTINDIILLFCAKLAVIDKRLFQKLKEFNTEDKEDERRTVRVNLFAIAHESQMPFELLFKKNLRKRQTDLFLDSWRKVTTKLGLPFQFKCTSKQQFFNLFMDAFQNCIEEIGNESSNACSTDIFMTPSSSTTTTIDTTNGDLQTSTTVSTIADKNDTPAATVSSSQQSMASSSVQHFRAKMASSFEQCKLWPISDEEYAELVNEAKKKMNNQSVTSVPSNVTKPNVVVNRPNAGLGAVVTKTTLSSTVGPVKRDSDGVIRSADECAVIKSLGDLINQDVEMQKLVKDMIRNELGKIISHMKPIEPSVAKTLPLVTSALQTVSKSSNKNDPTQTNLVRDLLEIIVETKRRENPFGLRTALNDLETLQRKFNMFKHNSARKSDLLRKVVTNLVPNSSRQLLNSLSRLLCEYYSTTSQQS